MTRPGQLSAAARRWRALLVGAGVLLLAARALGSGPPPARVHLEHSREPGAESCLAGEQLAREVEARLGRPVFAPAAGAELTARVVVRSGAERGSFRASVELFDEQGRGLGSRELESSDAGCASLNEPLVLVLSLAADMPAEARRALARESAGAGSAQPDVEASGAGVVAGEAAAPSGEAVGGQAPPPAAPAAPESGRSRASPSVVPSVGVVALLGPLPSPALGLELGVALQVAGWGAASLRAAGFLPARHLAPPGERGAELSARTLALELCPWMKRLGGLEARACAAQWVGRVQAHGFGFDEAQRTTRWLVAAGGSVSVSRRFGPLSVALSPQLLGVLVRRRYFFTDGGVDITLHEEPPLYGAVTLRVGAEL